MIHIKIKQASFLIFFLSDLRKIDVDCITLGQYMQPTKRHLKVSSLSLNTSNTLHHEYRADLFCENSLFELISYFNSEASVTISVLNPLNYHLALALVVVSLNLIYCHIQRKIQRKCLEHKFNAVKSSNFTDVNFRCP